LLPQRGIPVRRRVVLDQLLDGVVDEEDAGRLKRLDEPAGQPDGDAVVDPGPLAATDPHADVVRGYVFRGRADELAERRLRLLRLKVVTGVDVSGTDPADQRDGPDPTGVLGGSCRTRPDRVLVHVHRYLQRHRAVVGQRVLVGHEGLTERLV